MSGRETDAPDASKPFWGKCRSCAHCWPVAYYPFDLSRFVKIVKRAVCPKCGDTKPVVAKQDNGVLTENDETAKGGLTIHFTAPIGTSEMLAEVFPQQPLDPAAAVAPLL